MKTINHTLFREVIPSLYFVSASLSLIASLSILIAVIVKKGVNSFKIFPVFNIAAADFLASASLIASTMIFSIKISRNESEIGHWYADCRAIGALVLCFYGITFLLTASHPISLYLNTRRMLNGSHRSQSQPLLSKGTMERLTTDIKSIYVFSWIFPIVTAVTMGIVYVKAFSSHDKLVSSSYCRDECLQLFNNDIQTCHNRSSGEKKWFYAYKGIFQGSLVVVIMLDMIFYALFVKNCKNLSHGFGKEGDTERERIRRAKWKAFRYQLIFIVCWFPCLVLSVTTSIDMEKGVKQLQVWEFVFFVAQAIFSPLQGFLNSFVYGWTRRIFWNRICHNTLHTN